MSTNIDGTSVIDIVLFTGNDMLHILTSQEPQKLRVDMERFNGEKAYALYSRFSVADEASKYTLNVDDYRGDAGINEMTIISSVYNLDF